MALSTEVNIDFSRENSNYSEVTATLPGSCFLALMPSLLWDAKQEQSE